MATDLPCRFLLRLLLFTLLMASCWPMPFVRASLPQQPFLEQTILQPFFAAYQKKDSDGLTALWETASPEYPAFQKQTVQIFDSVADIKITGFKVLKSRLAATEVWLWLDVGISGVEKTTGAPYAEINKLKKLVVHCRQQAGVWKLWRCSPAYEYLASLLLSASSDEARNALLDEYREFVVMELAVVINARGNSLSNATPPDYPAAINAYRLAYDLAFRFGEKKRAFGWWVNLGNSWNRMGKPEQAMHVYEEGLALSRSLGEVESSSQFLYRIALVLTDLGQYPQASATLEESLKIQEALKQPALIAQTELAFGQLDYLQGNLAQSFARMDRCRAIREELLRQDPRNQNLRVNLAQVFNNLGILAVESGDYDLALRQFEQSLTMSQATGRSIENLLLNFGTVYEKQGSPDLAIEYYQKDLEISRKRNSKPATAQSLINIGLFHQTRKDFGLALDALNQALQISEEINHKDLRSKAHNLIGTVYFSQKQPVQALKQFGLSLALREQLNDREGIADTSHNLALAYAEQDDLAHALASVERAASLAQRIGKPELLWRANTTAGRIYLALGQPENAQSAWQKAVETIELLREKIAGQETQSQSFFENKTAPYLALTELLLAENHAAEALNYAERAKARVLLDVLQSGKLNLSKATTASEQEQERKFNNEIVALNTQFYREQTREQRDEKRMADISSRLEKARLTYEDFRTKLYVAHPELKVKRGEAKALTLEEAAVLLPDEKTALLDYVVTPERVQLFVLTKAKTGQVKLRVYPLAIRRDTLAAQVEQFRRQLAERNLGYGKLAVELYGSLLKTAKAELPAQAKLVIVPDGPLWELPFQALLTERNRYLWQEHAICYAPSLTVLREMQKPRRESRGAPSLFAIGDPALGGERVERVKALMGGVLEQLPEARTQVEALRKFYDSNRSKAFLGAAAMEEIVKAEAGAYDILHFATHGILNNRNPLYSHIVLAQADAKQTEAKSKEDGLLEAREIMQMDLHADLAVLSACETARGRVGAGEGMIGLTWALFVAGVPTTVVSQWQVRSDSTKDLMVEFHRLLQTANKQAAPRTASDWTKAEALRQAALKLLGTGQYRHPFYWAGFVLVGKPQ